MAGTGANDFFLQFGSNAEQFSRDIAGDLAPGVRQINALTEAILKYDETVGGLKTGNPLGGMFGQLDQAANKLEGVGDQISAQFGKIVNSLGRLSQDLNAALETVSRGAAASRQSARRNAQGFTEDQEKILAAQRRHTTNAAQVRDEETPAKRRQTESTISKSTRDADAARNAVKRVADINATLARNATDGANALKGLGEAIRTLTLKTKTTTKGVEEGRFQQNVVLVQGGQVAGGAPVQIDPAQIQHVLRQAGIDDARQAPARDEAHATARRREEERRSATPLSREQFNLPARPGSYQVPGETGTRSVSNRLLPSETYGSYFERTAENARSLATARQYAQDQSESRVGVQRSRELQRIQALIGRRGLDALAGDSKLRDLEKLPGTVRSEQIRASVGSVLAPGRSLTPAQYEAVPEALREFQRMQQDFAEVARSEVTRRVSANPLENFALPSEAGRRDAAFGQTRDFREAVRAYDERNPEGAGVGYRRQTEEVVANSRLDRNAQRGAYQDLHNPYAHGGRDEGTVPTTRTIGGNQPAEQRAAERAAEREAQATSEYDAMVEQAKAEARAARAQNPSTPVPTPGTAPGSVRLERGQTFNLSTGRLEGPIEPQPNLPGRAARSGGGGGRPPTNIPPAPAAAEPPEEPKRQARAAATRQAESAAKAAQAEERLAKTTESVANTQRRVDRLMRKYEEAVERAAAQYENLDDFNPNDHDEVNAAEGELRESQARLAKSQDRLARLQEEKARRLAAAQAPTAGRDQGTRATPASEANARPGRVRGTPFPMTENVKAFEGSLSDATRAVIEQERKALPNLVGQARQDSIERAGTALRRDQAFGSLGSSLPLQRQTLGTLLQLPRGGATNTALASVFARGGGSSAVGAAQAAAAAAKAETSRAASTTSVAKATRDAAGAAQRYNNITESAAGTSDAMKKAVLGLYQAEERLATLRGAAVQDAPRIAAAEQQVFSARQNVQRAAAQDSPTLQQKIFGQQGFGAGQLRHIGLGLENTIGYTLVFSGLDKLKEMVHNGLEAEASFTRLKASLDANGISAVGLRSRLQSISAETATPLEKVTEAAAELSGTLKNAADIKIGTEVAAQLANVSQGHLTPDESAVGLRQVVAAYGDTWRGQGMTTQQGLIRTGDDIARLSQLTGVNVKDITEGTTQIASEARDFGLNQTQAATIAAYVSQGTGQRGEEAAAQTSRLLSGLYNTNTQETLQRVLKPTNPEGRTISEQFQAGDIGGVLTELISQFEGLNDSSKQAIASLLGTGIQARAFAALVGGGAEAVKAMNGELSSTGALAKQNASFLQTIAGEIRRLDEDFQNFGSTLQRLGAFDALGLLAKAFDSAFRAGNFFFGKIADLADMSGPTKAILHFTVVLGEMAAAYKLLNGVVIGSALKTTLGTRLLGGVVARNAGAIAAANLAGEAAPRARYRFGAVREAVVANRYGFRPSDAAKASLAEREAGRQTVRSLEQRAIAATTKSLGSLDIASIKAAEALGAVSTAAAASAASEESSAAASTKAAAASTEQSAASTESAAASTRSAAASTEQAGASSAAAVRQATQGTLFPLAAAGPMQGTLFGGAGGAVGAGEAAAGGAAAAKIAGQRELPMLFRGPDGRIRSASQYAQEDLARVRAAEGALPGMSRAELAAANAGNTGRVIPATPEPGGYGAPVIVPPGAAGAARLGLLGRGLSAGGGPLAKVLGLANAGGKTGAFFGAKAGIPALAAAYIGTEYLHGADQEEDTRGKAADKILAGNGTAADLSKIQRARSFLDWNANTGPLNNDIPVLHTLGQAGNMLIHAAGFGGEDHSNPSDESNDKFFDLNREVFQKGVVEQLPELKSVDAVQKFQEKLKEQIAHERDKIQKAGGNDKQAQAQIAFNIDQLVHILETAGRNRIAALEGIKRIDLLNSQQVDDLQNTMSTFGSLSPETINRNPALLRNIIKSGSVTPGSRAYKALLQASGNDTNAVSLKADGTFSRADYGDASTISKAEKDKLLAMQLQKSRMNRLLGREDQQKLDVSLPNTLAGAKAGRLPVTKTSQLKAQLDAANEAVRSTNAVLDAIGKPNAKSQAAFQAASKQAAQALQTQQQAQEAMRQLPVDRYTGQAQVAESLSGTGGNVAGVQFGAGSAAPVGFLTKANAALKTIFSKLQADDPQYYAVLGQIQQNKVQIAQLQTTGAENALNLALASTSDQVRKAGYTYDLAVLALQRDQKAGASEAQIGQDRAAIASAGVGKQQAAFGVVQASNQLAAARQRNAVRRGQAELNSALAAEAVYRQGGLADEASLKQAEAQEVQARIQIRDAIEAQKESVLERISARQKYRSDMVAAAETDLAKAQRAYAYAVKEFGRGSTEANSARAQAYAARTALNQAVTEQITSRLDLQIAELNARGVGDGSDLGQEAARVGVQKARTALNRFLKEGGKKGTTEYNKLYADVVTAQRNAFDVALQAQLDTLDFQKETYQITSGQEIAALQQILKNKQLTLAEQRSITLKIKSLQAGIREQLTSGGLNIPSDIKLPTAYEVRRSLGAGFEGSSTKANIVNNNQTASVKIYQTLPTQAVVKAVATSVIDIINQQTGQQVRSNSATPRNVPIGRR